VIDIVQQGSVAVMTMRHGKANAMDIAFCNRITTCFEEFAASSARAAVLTGQGNMFSAGVDLIRATEAGPDYFPLFLPAMRRAFEAVFFCEKPVVAAINGHAIAGGCILACAADYRVMGREAGRIGVTELQVGVPFPVIALEIMRFAAAPHRLEQLVFGAATYDAQTAMDLGLVHEVVDVATVADRAVAVAQNLAALTPAAVALSKRQTRQVVADRLASDGPRFDLAVDRVWLSAETKTRMRDYVTRTFKKA
jgi:enoyl-CoA hydratase/carnithine racemase